MSASAIESGRVWAEAQMTTTLEAFAPGAEVTDADGMKTRGYTSQGTTPGKLQGSSARDAITRTISVGDAQVPIVDEGLHIPISAYTGTDGLLLLKYGSRGHGWEFQVTAVGLGDDPALVGRRFLVVSAPAKSKATARRLDVVEVTS